MGREIYAPERMNSFNMADTVPYRTVFFISGVAGRINLPASLAVR